MALPSQNASPDTVKLASMKQMRLISSSPVGGCKVQGRKSGTMHTMLVIYAKVKSRSLDPDDTFL